MYALGLQDRVLSKGKFLKGLLRARASSSSHLPQKTTTNTLSLRLTSQYTHLRIPRCQPLLCSRRPPHANPPIPTEQKRVRNLHKPRPRTLLARFRGSYRLDDLRVLLPSITDPHDIAREGYASERGMTLTWR